MTTLTAPADADIQFFPQKGNLHLEEIVDPTGAPLNVLDAGQKFTLKGHIQLPAWIAGLGKVRLFADEIGGGFQGLLQEVAVPIAGAAVPPASVKYPYELEVPGGTLPNPSTNAGVYHFTLTFTFESPPGVNTGIVAFFDLGTYFAA